MKKKKLTRKERKQQRQAEMAQRGKQPRQGARSREVAEDMSPLLSSGVFDVGILSQALETSQWMAGEPEFEGTILDPIESVAAYIQGMENRGVSTDNLNELPEEEIAEVVGDVFIDICSQTLVPEARSEVLDRLDALRQRKKAAGETLAAAQVAAVQSFLTESRKSSSEIWAQTGLVQSLVEQHVELGFELGSLAIRTAGLAEGDLEPLTGDDLNLTEYVEGSPALKTYLGEQAERMRKEWRQALFTGEVDLGLFTAEEREVAYEVLVGMFGEDLQQVGGSESRQEGMRDLTAYISARLTGERLEQLRARLAELAASGEFSAEQRIMLSQYRDWMETEDAVESEMDFLISAVLGETIREHFSEEEDEPG